MSNVVPEGWQIKPIGELVTLQYGKSPKEVIAEDGQYPVIGTGGITGFASSYLYDGCTTVIGRKGTINKPSYIEGKFWAIDTTYFGTCYKEAEPKWFYYSLQSFDLSKYNEASGVPSLGRDTLNAIPLLAPPLPEQKKIAAILSSVDEVIEKTRAQIDKLKDLKTGMMQELLTKGVGPGGVPHTEFKDSSVGRIPASWSTARLDTLAKVGSSKRIRESEYVTAGVPFFRSKEVIRRSKGLDIEKPLYISKQRFIEISEKFGAPKQGDILITAVGTIGVVYLVENREFYFKDGNLLWLKNIRPEVSPHYLVKIMASETFKAEIDRVTGGSSQAALTIEKLQELTVVVPPLDEQESIVRVLVSLDDKYQAVNRRLLTLQHLKKSLMQDLLTGKVRVQVDTRELADA
jgi:type I restriction enzyme S subunit